MFHASICPHSLLKWCLNSNLQGQRPEAREEAEAAGGGDEGLLGHVQRGHGARAGRRQGVHEPLASNNYKVYTLIGRFLRDRDWEKSYDLHQELYEYETMCNRATQLGGHNESIDLF